MEEIELYLEEAKEHMEKSVHHTQIELSKIRAGKANPNMLDGLMVAYYGSQTPINQVASVSTPEARTLMIKPWEKGMIQEIEKAIQSSDLGLTPQNDGEVVRLNIPVLTEERRLTLVKQAKSEAEHGRVSIRNVRKDANDHLKGMLKEGGVSEDLIKGAETDVQALTDKYIAQIDELLSAKEEDIMTV